MGCGELLPLGRARLAEGGAAHRAFAESWCSVAEPGEPLRTTGSKLPPPKRRQVAALHMNMNLKGKVALVTGGTKGIGHAIAAALVREGLAVCITSRNQDGIDATVQALGGATVGFV